MIRDRALTRPGIGPSARVVIDKSGDLWDRAVDVRVRA